MKNKKAFTLIELIAVIIIMGVILTIAVPNSLTMVNRNKKTTVISDANKPINDQAIIITLGYLDTDDVKESPYNNDYSKSQSFVVVTADEKEIVTGEVVDDYNYYVHLVACNDEDCTSISNKDMNNRYGIVLASLEELSSNNRIDLVKQGAEAQAGMLADQTISLDGYSIIKVYK